MAEQQTQQTINQIKEQIAGYGGAFIFRGGVLEI